MNKWKKKSIFLFGIIFVCLLLGGFYTYKNIWIPTAKDYDRTIYSVVIYNNTNDIVTNIAISYGCENNSNSSYEYEKNIEIKPNEYRKVNILTTSPSSEATLPYNVWVNIKSASGETSAIAGYFGKNTGGLAYLKILNEDDKLVLQRVFEYEKEYKNLYRRHRKNQKEISWY